MLEFLVDKLFPYKVKGMYYNGIATTHNSDGTITEKKLGERVYWEMNFRKKEQVENFLQGKKGPFYIEGKNFEFLRMENEKTYLVFDNSINFGWYQSH